MSEQFQKSKESDKEATDISPTNSPSKESPSNEAGWLISGLLILVLGIGGVLMFSQNEDYLAYSEKAISDDQFSQTFPSTAIASQDTTEPSEITAQPVSLLEEGISPNEEAMKKNIEEKVVYFDFDQATLTEEAKTHLAPQAQLLKDEHKTILVRGHTDQKGTEGYNQTLSLRRAKAVKEYLVSIGHAADSIHIEGLGKSQPVCTESTDTCASQNRRAIMYFAKSDSTSANPQPLLSQTISESTSNAPVPPKALAKVSETEPSTGIETVQLSESAEEIIPPDPIASTQEPQ